MPKAFFSSLARPRARFDLLAPVLLLNLLAACESEVPPPPKPGEVCWEVTPSENSSLCTDQRLCLEEKQSITLDDPNSDGFVCNRAGPLCPVPDSEHIEGNFAVFDYNDIYDHLDSPQTLSVSIAFKARIMLGYSLANFREHFENAHISWIAKRGDSIGSGPAGWMYDGVPKIEFLAYDPPLLHVRITAAGINTMTRNPTDPYLCFPSTGPVPLPGGPDICTEIACLYSADADDNVQFVAEFNLPIQQPTP